MKLAEKMVCSPFLRGFVPGTLIGVFTSVLLFSAWSQREPHLYAADDGKDLPARYVVSTRPEDAMGTSIMDVEKPPRDCGSEYLRDTGIIGSHLLLVLVHSNPRSFKLREAVRSSWLHLHKYGGDVAARFVVGTGGLNTAALGRLACENEKHKDMLFLPHVKDTTEWPSSTKLLQSFTWANDNANFSYVFKCNDATFAILDELLEILQLWRSQESADSLVWGYFAGGVQATKEGKLGEKQWFLCTHYLPYPQGGGYLISQDLVHMLAVLSDVLEHYSHDDIALGVWLSPFDNIHKRHDIRFNTGYYSRGCSNVYIATHRETAASMLQKAHLLETSGNICEEEFQTRLSYHYNWTAPASRCCLKKPGIP